MGRLASLSSASERCAAGSGLCFALALTAALALGACSDSRSPAGAVKAFAKASRAADQKAVYDLLAPTTREKLEREARSASTLSGGRAVKPIEMLRAGLADPTYTPTGFAELSRKGDRATVEVSGPAGRRDVVTVVKHNGRWLIELP